ncbi:MAG TPA: glycosyltransferase family 39 protein, partial [Anaerolineae bacterium]
MNRRNSLLFNHQGSATLVVSAITMLAFAVRMIGLAEIPPRWDEGWSVAHASLDVVSLLKITAADVHPPLFYLLLSAWQSVIGVGLFTARYLSVLVSVPAIPLAYAVTRAWFNKAGSDSWRLALLAAAFMAWLPLGVYYSAVIRMYALAPTLVLLAAWAGLRLASGRASRAPGWIITAFVIGAAGTMLTLYHAIWTLAALAAYLILSVFRNRKALKAHHIQWLAIAFLLSVIVFAPWAIFAIPQLLSRAAAGSSNIAQQYSFAYFLKVGLNGLTMSQQTGLWGITVMFAIIVAGVISAVIRRAGRELYRLGFPVFAVAFTLAGVAYAARNWTINERMLICAIPALALLLAWALNQLILRSRLLGTVAIIALVGVYFNTSTSFVYQKTLEVFEPYNPHTYAQHLAELTRPEDIVVFNVLSPAGFYSLDRKPTDPAWSYALTWDPVIEPRARWDTRIAEIAKTHARIWVVLYRGLAGKNGDLRGWLDTNFYPAQAMWGEEEVFYGLYGSN